MKKFFKLGKDKKSNTPESSPKLPRANAGSVPGYDITPKDEAKMGKLHRSAWNNEYIKVRQLAKKDASPIDKESRTPLHLACAQGHTQVVSELLEWKAKMFLGDSDGHTPLMKAVLCGQQRCAQLLFEARCDPNDKDPFGNTCLHYVAKSGEAPMAQLLLQQGKINPDIRNNKSLTPLMLAVKSRHLEVGRLLLAGGAEINLQAADGRSSLMMACEEGAADFTKLLLDFKADVNVKDKKGWTADDIAMMNNAQPCRDLLGNTEPPLYASVVRNVPSDVSPDVSPEPEKKSVPNKNMKGATAVNSDLFSPARNQAESESETENSVSEMKAAPGESWGDTDDEPSEIDNIRKKPVPGLNLTDLSTRGSTGDLRPTEPVMSSFQAKPATTPRTAEPQSARSVQSNWSEDGSLFSNDQPPKVPLTALHQQQKQKLKQEQQDSESEDDSWGDSLPLSSGHDNPPVNLASRKPPPSPQLQKPSHTPTKKGSTRLSKEEQKDLLKNSGVEDFISDVEGSREGSRQVSRQASSASSKQDTVKQADSPERVPSRLSIHDTEPWDSDTDEPPEPAPPLPVSPPPAELPQPLDEEEDWEEDVSIHLHLTRPQAPPIAPPTHAVIQKEKKPDDLNSDWDSDSAIPTSHGQDGRHSGRMGVQSTGIMYGSPTDEEEESEGEWMKEKREERERAARLEEESEKVDSQRVDEWDALNKKKEEQLKAEAQAALEFEKNDIPDWDEPEQQEKPVSRPPLPPSPRVPRSSPRLASEDELRHRRERAERDIEDSRLRQRRLSQNSMADDEDTFNNVPDMDTPRRTDVKSAATEDDCLSYSSTEQDLSGHEDPPLPPIPSSPLSTSNVDMSGSLVRMHEQLRQSQRRLDRERLAKSSLENKRHTMENERSDIIQKLEDVTRAKSQLEQSRIELDAKIRNLEYQVNEEVEKRKNAEILLSKTKEQLDRKEQQYTGEVENSQKTELTMRTIQIELRAAQSRITELEEERDDAQRQLTQEKKTRSLQEEINQSQLQLQHSLDHSHSQPVDKAEVASRLEATEETHRQALETSEKLRAELYAVKMELERQRAVARDDQENLACENEDLHAKLEDLKNTTKLNEEALTHASLQYGQELAQFKTENSKLMSSLESERLSNEKLISEVESLKARLAKASEELELAQEARITLERKIQADQEEWAKRSEEQQALINMSDQDVQNLNQRCTDAETRSVRLDNELQISNATLAERTSQLATLQKDHDQRRATHENLDANMRTEKEENARIQAKLESQQERCKDLQEELSSLRQQVEDERHRLAASESPDKLSALMLTSLRTDQDKVRGALEERNSTLGDMVSRLKEELHSVETRRTALDQDNRHLQTELSEANRRLSAAEASLDATNKNRDQVETERARMRDEMERVQGKLEQAREKQIETQARLTEATERLDRVQQSTASTHQQLASHSNELDKATKSKTELEETLHRLELDNARLEASLSHQTQKAELLQRELTESNQLGSSIKKEMDTLQMSNNDLQYKMTEAAATRTMATHEAQDAKSLWETEVKSRSKLGLRIAQLERERQEAQTALDEEKRKTRKAMELKKLAETKLGTDTEKMSQLQKEVTTLKVHLKAARKRLKMDRAHEQLDVEAATKEELVAAKHRLQREVEELRKVEKSHAKLQRSRQKTHDELLAYKNHVNANYCPRSEMETYKAEAEAQSRMELNRKLEQVNNYLAEQAAARERLDLMRDTTQNEMKRDFEQTQGQLLDELEKLRSSMGDKDTDNERERSEAERYRDLYEGELKLRERLASRLEKASQRANLAQSTIDRQRLDTSSLDRMDGKLDTAMLGKSLDHGVNDLSHRWRQELDRSIAKHMEKGPHISIDLPPRSHDDSMLTGSAFTRSSNDYLSVLKQNYML